MIFEAPQIFTARIDVLIDGTSVNGFPVDIDIFNESLDFSPVFWESDVDVSLSGKKRSNIRGYDLLLRLDYEHTLEPDKFNAIYEQLPNAIRYDTEIRLYPDATDTERYYAVVPTSSTVQSVMYESTVKGADKPTLEFENVELLDSVASYGSPSSAGGDADTLNGFTADDFLKSDANDTYEAGNTLTFNGDVNLQGVVSVGNLGGTPFSIGGVRLFENGDEQKLGVNESPEFAGLAIGNAIGDPFTVGGIRIFDAGDEQELGTSASPTFGGATFNGNFTAPDYNPSAWDDASDRAPTALSVNLSGILTLTRFNTTNLQADLQAWADTRYALDSALDPNWDTAYDRSVIGFDLVTNSLEIDRQNATTLSVNLGTWGAGLYFQKALNLSEGDPATMRNNLELGSSDSPTFAGLTLTGALSGTSAAFTWVRTENSTGNVYWDIRNTTAEENFRWVLVSGRMELQTRDFSDGSFDRQFIQIDHSTREFRAMASLRFDGNLTAGTTTVIDSSRNASFAGGTFTGVAWFFHTLDTDKRITINTNTGAGNNPRIYYWDENLSQFEDFTIGGANNDTTGLILRSNGDVDFQNNLRSGTTTVIDSSRNASFAGGTFTGIIRKNTDSPFGIGIGTFNSGSFRLGNNQSNRAVLYAETTDSATSSGWLFRTLTSGTGNSDILRINSTGDVIEALGVIRANSGYKVNTNTVIDSSRNFFGVDGTFTGSVIFRAGSNNIRVQESTNGNKEWRHEVTNSHYRLIETGVRVKLEILPGTGDFVVTDAIRANSGFKVGGTTIINSSRLAINFNAFRTDTSTTDYSFITRSGGNTALYVNQVSATGLIARFGAGSASPNNGVVFSIEHDIVDSEVNIQAPDFILT